MVVAQTGQGIAPVEPTTPQQLVVEQPSVATKTAVKPGVTPDSPLWALDVLFDKIALALIQDPASRAEYELKISSERLSEMNEMKRIDHKVGLSKALASHKELSVKLEKDISNIDDNDVNIELNSKLRIDSKLKEHSRLVEEFERELGDDDESIRIKASLDKDVFSLRKFIETELNGTIIEAEREFGEEEVKAIINGTLFEIENERGRLKIEVEGRDDDDRRWRDSDSRWDRDDDDRWDRDDDDRWDRDDDLFEEEDDEFQEKKKFTKRKSITPFDNDDSDNDDDSDDDSDDDD